MSDDLLNQSVSPHLEAVSVAAVQLQQAFSAGSAGRRPGKGLLHVDHPLAQPPLKTIQLVKLFHLRSPESTVVTSASPHPRPGGDYDPDSCSRVKARLEEAANC